MNVAHFPVQIQDQCGDRKGRGGEGRKEAGRHHYRHSCLKARLQGGVHGRLLMHLHPQRSPPCGQGWD